LATADVLETKRVLLGVGGGIAAYKSAELIRRLRERGAEVRVVMTDGAARFITPLTLQALSGHPVRDSLWDDAAEAAMGHIELARWADVVLIAPTTADLMARLAHGLANDLLSTLCLASEAPLVLAPAMNRVMWQHPATVDNAAVLARRGVVLAGPDAGLQACGEEGAGRMMEPPAIVAALCSMLSRVEKASAGRLAASSSSSPSAPSASAGSPSDKPLAGATVLVTAGPTREALDPVRFLSNRSSGRMGYAVARAAADAGASVLLVSGPVALAAPDGVERVSVESARSMHEAVMARVGQADIFIGAAAVADYECTEPAPHKLKKAQLGERMVIELGPAPDILTSVAARADRPFTVGFAAETRDLEPNARDKLERKRLDMIAGNLVGEGQAFDCEDNAITLFWPDGGRAELGHADKGELARRLVAVVAERYAASRAPASKGPAPTAPAAPAGSG
jgi:phosphopantothenoylcysteine decarboxylase/phosphopantothenate--cysteine ligase